MTPLGVSGGIHCKVTELELTETISNDRGSLGTTSNDQQLLVHHMHYHNYMVLFICKFTLIKGISCVEWHVQFR